MITRGEFDVHLAVWKVRAEAAGKREGTDFWIQLGGTGTAGESRTIRFAPRRRLMGTGPLTGDSAVFSFTGTFGLKSSPKFVAGVLEEVILSCDEHRTQGRESPAAVLPPPVPRQNGRPLAAPGEVGTEVGLDGGRTVRFGQAVGDVDQALGLVGREGQPPLARKGRDRETVAPTATLDFDTGRLEKIRFNATHVYARPVRVFAEAWQNPDSIGDLGLRLGLTRPEFQAYLDAWRKRAGDAGKREGADYRISGSGPDELTGEMIFVALAPERLTGNGRGIWSDDWSVSFVSVPGKPAVLSSLSVLLDAFNTRARPPPGTRDPALTGVTLEDGTELYFGQAQAEIERLLGVTARAAALRPGLRGTSEPRISLPQVGLGFDTGRLYRIDYRRITEPPAPFPEQWKNLRPIGARSVALGMTKEKFREYLEAWHGSAAEQGFLVGRHYYVRESTSEQVEALQIGLPPSGVSAGGARVADTWIASFNPKGQAPDRTWVLVTLQAARGELSSRAPSPAAQRNEELKEMAKQLPKIELPKLEIVPPKP